MIFEYPREYGSKIKFIAGPPGSGKTQIVLELLKNKKENITDVVIDTEGCIAHHLHLITNENGFYIPVSRYDKVFWLSELDHFIKTEKGSYRLIIDCYYKEDIPQRVIDKFDEIYLVVHTKRI